MQRHTVVPETDESVDWKFTTALADASTTPEPDIVSVVANVMTEVTVNWAVPTYSQHKAACRSHWNTVATQCHALCAMTSRHRRTKKGTGTQTVTTPAQTHVSGAEKWQTHPSAHKARAFTMAAVRQRLPLLFSLLPRDPWDTHGLWSSAWPGVFRPAGPLWSYSRGQWLCPDPFIAARKGPPPPPPPPPKSTFTFTFTS